MTARFRIALHGQADGALDRLQPAARRRIMEALEGLKADPFKPRSGADIVLAAEHRENAPHILGH